MISKQDVEKLAGLSRLALTSAEMDRFLGEIDSILGFVAKVKEVGDAASTPVYASVNVLREDVVLHSSGDYTEKLVAAAPLRDGNFVKVKKILE